MILCCEGRETATIREDCAKAPACHKLRNASCAVKVLVGLCAAVCEARGATVVRACALEGRQLWCEYAGSCANVRESMPRFSALQCVRRGAIMKKSLRLSGLCCRHRHRHRHHSDFQCKGIGGSQLRPCSGTRPQTFCPCGC